MKSQGFSVGKNTIYDYLNYIEDAYLIFMVPLYSESLRKVQTNLKKTYAIDTGLIKAYSMSFSENIGRLFENLIYIDLRRRGHDVYYYLTKEHYEVDFLSCDGQGKWHLYQVVWDIANEATLAREQRALTKAEKELNIPGQLLTPDVYITQWLK